jgi:NTP pyrophosphatase (non-canonical NTP hydrolase)
MSREESTGFLNALAKQCAEDSDRWFGDMPAHDSLPHHALAMAGEVGEFCNVVKKVDRGSLDINDPKVRIMLANELTDVFTYLLNLAAILRTDLERSYLHVRAHNEQRFMLERKARDERRGN